MNRGFHRVAAATLIALLLPVVAVASTARLRGLNAPGDYVKGEDTGMFTYLSGVNSLGNLVYVEAGSYYSYTDLTDHAVGAVLPGLFDGRFGVWSFNLRQEAPALGQTTLGASLNPGDGAQDGNQVGEAFDILWGHKLGSGSFALRVNRSFESTDNGTLETEGQSNGSRNVMGLGAGYGWDFNPSTQVEVAALLQNRTFDQGPSGFSNDGTSNYLIAARAFHKASGNLTVIPVIKYFSIDRGFKNNATDAITTNKRTGWQAGLAGNWNVGTDDLLVFGFQVAQNRDDRGDGNKDTETLFPNVFLALETQVNPWLAFRAGAQNPMFLTYKDETSTTEITSKGHYFTFNLGATVKLGNLELDAVLDPAFLQNPFAQLMGGASAYYDGENVAFPEVSATYRW
ncbi:MAG: hypothetical protein IT348_15350 [Candidatus Eisenbacteria bacterium]|nr:hypothetical protein [Candidatus Eisenbacteria bacterium]